MVKARGTVALIGSGELSGTMVEVHKALLSRNRVRGGALFLDTPAGFQENADLISRRAVQYFEQQILHHLEVASFKSFRTADSPGGEKVFRLLGEAGYVLIGPGSPTYAVRHLKETPIPALLGAMVARGGCLVVASAAALTVGSHTLPVYEIYKVGEAPHWVGGLDILSHLGLDLVVIPHWNNAEGGNHDTRYCYMGETRFRLMEAMLPPGTTILGLDEHTACIMDYSKRRAVVEGLGRVTIRRDGVEQSYARRDQFSFERMLDGSAAPPGDAGGETGPAAPESDPEPDSSFWQRLRVIESAFHRSLEQKDFPVVISLMLETDSLLWQAQLDLENPEYVSQGREVYREMLVLAGTGIEREVILMPRKFKDLVSILVDLRQEHRLQKRWPEADQIRSILKQAGVVLEDTAQGSRWRI